MPEIIKKTYYFSLTDFGHKAILFLLFMTATEVAFAESRALLVGVSGYHNLPAEMQLTGPRNDVVLLSRTLKKLGVNSIKILADGVAQSSGNPTHERILQSIADEIAAAHSGDWLIVYFAGHGSQQPQPMLRFSSDILEPDGLDEIFLPLDAGRWDGRQKRVSNALVDNEIGMALSRAKAKGVSVWAIFDTCHAGDMVKALPKPNAPRQVMRRISPAMLGVPNDTQPQKNRRQITSHRRFGMDETNQSSLVAFYASLPDEPTSEEVLPSGTTGIFTRHLTQTLDSLPKPADQVSFNKLMSAVQSRYRDEGRPFPTPSLEGDGKLTLPF